MIHLHLPSILQSIRAIEPAFSGLPVWSRLSAARRHDVVLATTELVSNAIIHGNRLERDRIVGVFVEDKNVEIVIVVEDEGQGFDPESVADPLDPERREQLGGRGLHVVRALVDQLTFEHVAGRHRVTITIQCP